MVLEKLTPTGRYTINVYCGLVKSNGKQVVGCGKLGKHNQFYFKLPSYNLTSTVSLCEECEKVEKAKSSADLAFHQHNIDNDESVFG